MNQEIKTQWTEALRSGDYPQDQGDLRNSHGFCCLGVLCDLAVKANVIPEPETPQNGVYVYAGKVSYLPFDVIQWAELDGSNPLVTNKNGVRISLATMNDTPYSFDHIADVIEESL
jgi:hypothetical protein